MAILQLSLRSGAMALKKYILGFSVLAITLVCGAAQQPRFNYQAKLSGGGGVPLQGVHTLYFKLFQGGTPGSANSGTEVFSESSAVTITNGVANHTVGTGVVQVPGPLTANMLRTNGDVHLQVSVDSVGNVILPRTRLESVPYAVLSADGEVRTPISQPQSFPLVISQPGSFYLTGNITGVAGQDGIQVTTSGVTLDLNGFSLIGVPGSGNGIFASGLRGVTVQNGHVTGWGSKGISLSSPQDACRFVNLTLRSNGNTGLDGPIACVVENCIAISNAGHGISVGGGSTVRGCTSDYNTTSGFVSLTGCSFADCNANGNGTDSVGDGFNVGVGCNLSQCNAYINKNGFKLQGEGNVTNCTARGNSLTGILSTGLTNVVACDAPANAVAGINVGNDSQVTNCNVSGNTLKGIVVDQRGTVTNCTASHNGTIGIEVGSYCRVEGNTCSNNAFFLDGNGILALGNSNSIVGNHVALNAQGIKVNGTKNVTIKNTATANTASNYDLTGTGGNGNGTTAAVGMTNDPLINISL
uniref:Parallel beta-helix repeat protein n=1 Tax=uncultured bacterium AOCefta2 TaxID=654977 RepID=D6MLW6_9BACT|nr:parallel beta-helix repeat protein [uncultured bacterium AOCefta2]